MTSSCRSKPPSRHFRQGEDEAVTPGLSRRWLRKSSSPNGPRPAKCGTPFTLDSERISIRGGCAGTAKDNARLDLVCASPAHSLGTFVHSFSLLADSEVDNHVVDSSERSGSQLVEPQGRPPRGSAGLLFGFLAWTDHSDRDRRRRRVLWPGCGHRSSNFIFEGDAGRHRCEGGRGDACWSKPSRRGRARNRSRDRCFAVCCHRRRRAVEGRTQRCVGSGGVQRGRPVALRPQLRIVLSRRAGSWFSPSRLAPRNGRPWLPPGSLSRLTCPKAFCILSACWSRSPLWRSYSR